MNADIETFDLAVIGAGSGGLATAQAAARLGARVVLFEPGLMGGTCVNVGCVPKKAMWLAADAASQLRMARELGFSVEIGGFDWTDFVRRREAYIARARDSYGERLALLGVTLIPERARLGENETVSSASRTVRAEHRVIATGSHPRLPDLPGAELGALSDDFFALPALPARIAIVGAGYIAVEFAGIARALGAEVAVLVRGEQVLGHFDPDLQQEMAASMFAQGIELHREASVHAVERGADGRLCLRYGTGQTLEGIDWLLWATGRHGNSGDLGLEALGVACDSGGHIVIDAEQNTTRSGIYALGDVGTQPALTPVAIAAGRRLAQRLFGVGAAPALDSDCVPTVVFAQPPVASCGLSEPAARERHGDEVRVFSVRFRPMREALAGRSRQVYIKLVCVGSEERIVGLHMTGPGVDEMLQGFAVALVMGATRADFNRTLAIHPTASEEVVLIGP